MAENNFFENLKSDALLVNDALEKLYSGADLNHIRGLLEAEEYSLMAGGKRIRPIIALAFCRLFGGSDEAVLPYACALEMIHTASLVHDDLPCMDNDDLRRGRPTNHVVFGEAVALLVGDGLLTDAFGVVAKNKYVSAELNLQAVSVLSEAVGIFGMVGGQYIDIMSDASELSVLEKMHSLKTGAMIKASAVMGALAAGVALDDPRMADVTEYARCIGLTFQIIDDILDVTETAENLGKTPGKDKEENKKTFLSFYTVDEAFEIAEKLTVTAIKTVKKYGESKFLTELADYLLTRRN